MKIFLMTDMEGVCGVMNYDDWVIPEGRYYEKGKELLTLEVNAAVDGFFSAGASEIHVCDAHGCGGINQAFLDERVQLLNCALGKRPYYMDETYDAVAWVGQHAKSGTEYAHLPHTFAENVLEYSINGYSVGEFGVLAFIAENMGVTPIFCSGDYAAAAEAKELVKGIETVEVKRGLTKGSGDEYDGNSYMRRNVDAIHLHPVIAREQIRQGAERALMRFRENREGFTLPSIQPPYEKYVKYRPFGGQPGYEGRVLHPDNLLAVTNMKISTDEFTAFA